MKERLYGRSRHVSMSPIQINDGRGGSRWPNVSIETIDTEATPEAVVSPPGIVSYKGYDVSHVIRDRLTQVFESHECNFQV